MRIKKSFSLITLSLLLFGQLSAHAFTPYQVENETKVLLYWGDLNQSASNTNTFDPTIAPNLHRIMAITGVNLENNDAIIERDSNNTGLVEIDSTITPNDTDGVMLLLNNNEDKLFLEFSNLPDQTIDINALKSNDFNFTQGNYSVVAKYIGNKFLQTPENPSTANSFNDTPSSEWYFKYVQRIKDRKVDNQPIFEGYKNPDGSLTGVFSPGGEIKVGEMLKVVLRSAGHNETLSNLDASLVGSSHWSVGFQNRAIQLDLTIMQAVGIDPERVVSRGEFFQALVEALNLSPNCDTFGMTFVDLDTTNPYTDFACVLIRDGIISGTDDGFLNLFSPINRAEVAKILNTTLDVYSDQPSDVLNTLSNLNLSNTGTNNNQGGGNNNNSGGNTNPNPVNPTPTITLSDKIIQHALPTQADRFYEVKSETDKTIKSFDKSLIEIILFDNGKGEFFSDNLIDVFPVNNNTILRIKVTNQDWENEEYQVIFKEGAITYSDDTISTESSQLFNLNFVTTGPIASLETPDLNYNNSLMAVRIDIDDAAGDIDLSNNPKTAVNIQRSSGSVPFTNVEVTKAFNDNDIVIFMTTDKSITEGNAGGDYQLTIDGLKYASGLDLPKLDATFTINARFVNEGVTATSTLTSDSSPFRINFPNNSSAVRLDDLELTLERVTQVQGGNPDYEDQTNQLSTPIINQSGQFSILKNFQWSNGNYILTIKDTRFSQTKSFSFTVNAL